MTLVELNGLPEEAVVAELLRCCGCAAWASAVVRRRPFASKDALFAAADEEWSLAGPAEWLEAFAHHPRIGGKDALRAKFSSTVTWAKCEQAGTAAADEATLDGLAKGNEEYERKNGFIFIVCATGKTANEMLLLLNQRLPNEKDQEMKIAAAEQQKITKLRLEKLIL